MANLKRLTSIFLVITLFSFTLQFMTQLAASATTFTVTSTADDGPGSLRQAIVDANNSPGHDIIVFDFPGSGPHVLNIETHLIITDSVTIDGTSAGSVCATEEEPAKINVQLDFLSMPNSRLHISSGSNDTLVKGLSLVNSNYSLIVESDNVQVSCNTFQLNPDGTENENNKSIAHVSGENVSIGGPSIGERNYFVGYSGIITDGINTKIENNLFGLTVDGTETSELSNPENWISLQWNASSLEVRNNTFANARSAINGANLYGFEDSVIVGNYIGTDVTGTKPFGLESYGIILTGHLDGITIGGPNLEDRNIIVGSSLDALRIDGVEGDRNIRIENNYIGVKADGTAYGNEGDGIRLQGNDAGTATVINNVVSANGGAGIDITRTNTVLENNIVGLDPNQTNKIPNGSNAVSVWGHGFLEPGEVNHIFGGAEGKGNIVLGGSSHAGYIFSANGTYPSVINISHNIFNENNKDIHLANQSLPYPQVNGVIANNQLSDSSNTSMEIRTSGELNISNNQINDIDGVGISIHSGSHTIENNAIINTDGGIYSEGGDHTFTNNHISQSSSFGIRLKGSDHQIKGNTLQNTQENGIELTGTGMTTHIEGNTVIANGWNGINVSVQSEGKIIDNIISHNASHGIEINHGQIEVSSNEITDSGSYGIIARNNTEFEVTNNVITHNLKGIVTSGNASGPIYQNIVHSNEHENIDIGEDGYNAPNSGITNYPIIRSAKIHDGNTVVTFEVNLGAGDYRFDICYNLTDSSTSGACEEFKATLNVEAVQGGTQTYEITVPGTGYTTSRFSMQSIHRVDGSLVASSEFGGYEPFEAALSFVFFDTESMVGSPSKIAPGDRFHADPFVAPYGLFFVMCHNGGEDVTSFSISAEALGIDVDRYYIDVSATTAVDPGSITSSGAWTGRLVHGNCIKIYVISEIIGLEGTNATLDLEVENLKNVNGFEIGMSEHATSTTQISLSISNSPDIVMHTRLLTQGDITPGTNLSYELTVVNEGPGSSDAGFFMLAFLLPDEAQFSGLVDLDESDDVTIIDGSMVGMDPSGCDPPVLAPDISPGLAAYNGQVVRCVIGGHGVAEAGFTTKFRLDMVASSGFVSGSTRAIAVAMAFDETESMQFMTLFATGQDGFTLGLNNIAWLTYDSDPLTVTINRCAGVNEVIQVNDACFNVSFNKEIYAPSFTIDDLVLQGGGTIYSFVQNSSTQWTVRITGMTPGGTLRLLLGPASVIDYSAITNGAQVLGENVVRFSSPSSSADNQVPGGAIGGAGGKNTGAASGYLPNTGSDIANLYIALLLITAGMAINLLTRRKAY